MLGILSETDELGSGLRVAWETRPRAPQNVNPPNPGEGLGGSGSGCKVVGKLPCLPGPASRKPYLIAVQSALRGL